MGKNDSYFDIFGLLALLCAFLAIMLVFIVPSQISTQEDVNLIALIDEQILMYNATTGKWTNTNSTIVYYNQNLNTTAQPYFNGLYVNGSIIINGTVVINGTVDGVDISELLIKTTKISDLGIIWDKTNKIAYIDTSITKTDLGLGNVENTALSDYVNQAVKTTSLPQFSRIYLKKDATCWLELLNAEGARVWLFGKGITGISGTANDFEFYPYADGKVAIYSDLYVYSNLQVGGNYKAADGSAGWTGTFTSGTGQTVTVKNGLITGVS